MSVPTETTLAVVDVELAVIRGYADRHRLTVEWNPTDLVLNVHGEHPANDDPVQIRGDLVGYRAVAPAWTVFCPDTDGRFPTAGNLPNGKGSMFHGSGVICTHFNRLAYGVHGGPHKNWGGPGAWLDIREQVYATTLGEMLKQIVVHLKYSPGWTSPVAAFSSMSVPGWA